MEGDILDPRLEPLLSNMLNQLVWYSYAMKKIKEEHGQMPLWAKRNNGKLRPAVYT